MEVGRFVHGLGMAFRLANAHQLPFPDGSAAEVYASHVFEHYLPTGAEENGLATVDTLLEEWRRVLRPGGTLYVAVPDLLTCARRILSEPRQREQWVGMLFGYHRGHGDTHHWAYTEGTLRALLVGHRFRPLGRFKPFIPNPAGSGFDCAGAHCLDDAGRIVPASLNLMAEKA
jgi:SAM-dependent methyltransferase